MSNCIFNRAPFTRLVITMKYRGYQYSLIYRITVHINLLSYLYVVSSEVRLPPLEAAFPFLRSSATSILFAMPTLVFSCYLWICVSSCIPFEIIECGTCGCGCCCWTWFWAICHVLTPQPSSYDHLSCLPEIDTLLSVILLRLHGRRWELGLYIL